MILNTGCRTDIPAYYSRWFYNRINAGYVCTRNPYRPNQVLKYRLDPELVDILCFCTKNPAPMLPRLAELDRFRQFWFVTLTPYGKEIEPNVPYKRTVSESIRRKSGQKRSPGATIPFSSQKNTPQSIICKPLKRWPPHCKTGWASVLSAFSTCMKRQSGISRRHGQ
ncbi:hypothetical protein HMPREF9623_01329 [Stomatobaculum longum]|uniref:DUF1848 family protein n=1 Tax=Stomatobaculum longum TaxID=796942 RepID=A0AA37DG47_9FIRM|nr:hypothetical protein HMPREF9623_01329 [Stomatobaculum longum]